METLGSKVAGWLLTADEAYGPDMEEQIRIAKALTAVVELHYGCRHCGEHRPCREIVVIAEALGLVEVEG